jgi:phosphoribosylcarboxyaminoimidazole (NCAIR) mutase
LAETSRTSPISTPPEVGIVLGRRTDLGQLAPAADPLGGAGVSHRVRLVSADRMPAGVARDARAPASRARPGTSETLVGAA